ncbi:MAG: membrane protein insertase YidC [Planctomycetota bacterium]
MDKRNLSFFLFAAVVWLGWVMWWQYRYPPKKPTPKAVAKADATPKDAKAAETKEAKPAETKDVPKDAVADKGTEGEKPAEVIAAKEPSFPKRDDLRLGGDRGTDYRIYATLSSRGGVVTSLQLNRYDNEDRTAPFMLLSERSPGHDSFVLTVNNKGAEDLSTKNWEVVKENGSEVVFRTTVLGGKIQVEKRFLLQPDKYTIALELAWKNLTSEPVEQIQYSMTGGNGLPVEGEWFTNYFRNMVVTIVPKNGAFPFLEEETSATIAGKSAEGEKQTVFVDRPIQYAGITSQYFASVVVQEENPLEYQRIAAVSPIDFDKDSNVKSANMHNIGVLCTAPPLAVAAGGEVVHKFLLYNGPKDPKVLEQYSQYHLPLLVHYPNVMFMPIQYVAPVMVWMLNKFHALTGDYGIAIILLTLAVRGCMFPLTFRQSMSMQKMQAIQPKMQAIREKYANDKEKLNRALMDLYSKEKVNPFGGCLPMLLQFPIFIGLWQSLSNSFSLRQSSFLYGLTWIKDLAAPDQLWQFPQPLPILGPYLNLLPFLAMAQMILQMRFMSPPATTPEQQMQKKMMTYMMIFMGFLFYKVPAGLCVYIITSGAWSLTERKLLPKPAMSAATATPETVAVESANANGVSWKSPIAPKKKDKPRR